MIWSCLPEEEYYKLLRRRAPYVMSIDEELEEQFACAEKTVKENEAVESVLVVIEDCNRYALFGTDSQSMLRVRRLSVRRIGGQVRRVVEAALPESNFTRTFILEQQ